MVSQATTQPSHDPAAIGPEDLWAVWILRPAFLVDAGADPVNVKWVLAAPGDEGLNALASREGFGAGLLAAFPLVLLQQMALALPDDSDHTLPKWVRAAIGTGPDLIFVRAPDGSTRVASGVKGLKRGDKELLRGARQDFYEVLNAGNQIIEKKSWGKIDDDLRPFVKQGEVGWLHYQRSAKGAESLKRLIEMSDLVSPSFACSGVPFPCASGVENKVSKSWE